MTQLNDLPMGKFFTDDPSRQRKIVEADRSSDYRMIDNSNIFIMIDDETYPTITYVVGRFNDYNIVYEDNVQHLTEAFELALKLHAKYPEKGA